MGCDTSAYKCKSQLQATYNCLKGLGSRLSILLRTPANADSRVLIVSEIANHNANYLLGPSEASLPVDIKQADFGAPMSSLFGISRHYVLAAALTCCYVVFYSALSAAEVISASGSVAIGLFAAWLLGALMIVRWALEIPQLTLSASRLDVLLAIWVNTGVVAAATLAGGDMRLILLVGVVFGVLFSGLHFNESRVRTVLLTTLVSYTGCVILRASFAPLSFEFELLCAFGLAVFLLAASLIAREIIQLRLQARARNRQLAQALRRVEELALRDELTGLYNRRHLLDFVERAVATRERGGPSFTLAYCDLDYFKRVNDRFGHECGDRLLKAFSSAALSCVRNNDLVARLGGEEFVLILVDTDTQRAAEIVERLRMRTANISVSSAEPDYQVTVSAGLATHIENDTVDSILRRADGALYQAKEQGRDQLVTV